MSSGNVLCVHKNKAWTEVRLGSGTAKVKRLRQVKLERSVVFVPPQFFVDKVLVFVFVVKIGVGDVAATLAFFFGSVVFS